MAVNPRRLALYLFLKDIADQVACQMMLMEDDQLATGMCANIKHRIRANMAILEQMHASPKVKRRG